MFCKDPGSIEKYERREDDIERRLWKRQQAELFGEWDYRMTSGESADQREVRLFYLQKESCTCGHERGFHDYPMGRCMEHGCQCAAFKESV